MADGQQTTTQTATPQDQRALGSATQQQLQETGRYSTSVYDPTLAGEALREQIIRAQQTGGVGYAPYIQRQLQTPGVYEAALAESQKFQAGLTAQKAQQLVQEQATIQGQQRQYEASHAAPIPKVEVPTAMPQTPQATTGGYSPYANVSLRGPPLTSPLYTQGYVAPPKISGVTGGYSTQPSLTIKQQPSDYPLTEYTQKTFNPEAIGVKVSELISGQDTPTLGTNFFKTMSYASGQFVGGAVKGAIYTIPNLIDIGRLPPQKLGSALIQPFTSPEIGTPSGLGALAGSFVASEAILSPLGKAAGKALSEAKGYTGEFRTKIGILPEEVPKEVKPQLPEGVQRGIVESKGVVKGLVGEAKVISKGEFFTIAEPKGIQRVTTGGISEITLQGKTIKTPTFSGTVSQPASIGIVNPTPSFEPIVKALPVPKETPIPQILPGGTKLTEVVTPTGGLGIREYPVSAISQGLVPGRTPFLAESIVNTFKPTEQPTLTGKFYGKTFFQETAQLTENKPGRLIANTQIRTGSFEGKPLGTFYERVVIKNLPKSSVKFSPESVGKSPIESISYAKTEPIIPSKTIQTQTTVQIQTPKEITTKASSISQSGFGAAVEQLSKQAEQAGKNVATAVSYGIAGTISKTKTASIPRIEVSANQRYGLALRDDVIQNIRQQTTSLQRPSDVRLQYSTTIVTPVVSTRLIQPTMRLVSTKEITSMATSDLTKQSTDSLTRQADTTRLDIAQATAGLTSQLTRLNVSTRQINPTLNIPLTLTTTSRVNTPEIPKLSYKTKMPKTKKSKLKIDLTPDALSVFREEDRKLRAGQQNILVTAPTVTRKNISLYAAQAKKLVARFPTAEEIKRGFKKSKGVFPI